MPLPYHAPKADKSDIDKKADEESLRAIQDFFRSKMEVLEKLRTDIEGATSDEDLAKLRKELENEFKVRLASISFQI